MLIVFFLSTYKYQIYDWFILLDLIFFLKPAHARGAYRLISIFLLNFIIHTFNSILKNNVF